jgi:MraZ protein
VNLQLRGEYEIKIDERGRLKMPSKLLDSLYNLRSEGFVVNRGFEKNLIIYPKRVWDEKTKQVNQLNFNDKQQRDVIRFFYRGATDLVLDSSERVNLPANLLRHAGIEKDVVLVAMINFIEVWSLDEYDKYYADESTTFGELTQGLSFPPIEIPIEL